MHEIQLARLQLAKAESQRKSDKEQARVAKRRRKEAKAAARRAGKQAKLAKRAVAEAEQKLAQAVKRKAVVAPGKKAIRSTASPSPKPKRPVRPKPASSVPGPRSQPTDQIGKAVEETRGGSKTETEKFVEPAISASPAPSSDQPPTPGETAA